MIRLPLSDDYTKVTNLAPECGKTISRGKTGCPRARLGNSSMEQHLRRLHPQLHTAALEADAAAESSAAQSAALASQKYETAVGKIPFQSQKVKNQF